MTRFPSKKESLSRPREGKGLSYALVPTRWGWAGALRSDRGLLRLALPRPSPQAALALLAPGPAREDAAAFGDLPQRLQAYFLGQPVSFPDALDLEGATPFRRAVWLAARTIGHGQVRTYGWLASQMGRPGAARAVGQALGANPLPLIIPCHRVVARDGGLGGWSGGDIGEKQALLELEAGRAPTP